MYLHRLELRAIGPYPDTVTIDFAALAASGVFLLEGPTGSGKSTIIDAVVFALYGGLAGADASNDRLHSQHADPSVEPYVELVFETGAGVFRVRRTPQYDRPKQRGTGTVKQQASAQLLRLAGPSDAAGEPLSARIPEVGAEIARIVGLDRAQFLQTVVLPQGEFARFLRSPGEDRRKLLQSLFGTQVYDRTAEELAARRRAVLAEVEGADARVRDALARFAQAADVDTATESDLPGTVDALRDAAQRAEGVRADAAAAARAAAEHEALLRARATAVVRRRDLLARLAALDAGSGEVEAARQQLERSSRAARVVSFADSLDAARDRAAAARADAATLRERHGLEHGADVGALAERLRASVEAERHLVDLAARIDARTTALDAARRDLAALEDDVAERDRALQGRPARRAELVARATAAAETAAGGTAAEHEVERLVVARRDRAALAEATRRLSGAEQAVVVARTAAESALATERDLRDRRIAGLAGELGAALEDGSPCPVCGAVEHPVPAAPKDDHPTTDAVDQAADRARAAEAALGDAAADLRVAEAEHRRLADTVGGLDDADLAAAFDDATAAVTAAQDASRAAVALDRELTTFDEATRASERARNDAETRRAVLATAVEADAERLREDAEAIGGAVARLTVVPVPGVEGGSALAPVVRAIEAHVAVLGAVVRADAAVDQDDRVVADRTVEVDAALEEHGFDEVSDARAALLDDAAGRELRQMVDDAIAARGAVDAGLADPAVQAAAADADVEFDVAGAAAEREWATDLLDEATRAAVTATDRSTAVQRCAAELAVAVRARDDTSARSRAVVRLADVANGATAANPSGITLGTYVLMRRFEDVVAAANDRLRGMLGGRFTLETSDERESGSRARRTGLALAVHDHTTDTVRDPRSLSGGETFTVSLCLALGLADVVQAEAGGVSLGTLFVDEGFGTLDPEALDGVLVQLSRLTAGGRQVGIVSHVEELKQRIPERIAVRRTPDGGSRVTTTV
ncbi:AAA family ATPase [Curtobacterium sp. NPDC089689]|uniref:AAA family ATPase n=1 Tax=Curtobacterium sp. NPDC089689 TaxID=3363968 RepID=UPI00381C359C